MYLQLTYTDYLIICNYIFICIHDGLISYESYSTDDALFYP